MFKVMIFQFSVENYYTSLSPVSYCTCLPCEHPMRGNVSFCTLWANYTPTHTQSFHVSPNFCSTARSVFIKKPVQTEEEQGRWERIEGLYITKPQLKAYNTQFQQGPNANIQPNQPKWTSISTIHGCILKGELLRNIDRKSLMWKADLTMKNTSSKEHIIFRNYVLNFVDLYGFFIIAQHSR